MCIRDRSYSVLHGDFHGFTSDIPIDKVGMTSLVRGNFHGFANGTLKLLDFK